MILRLKPEYQFLIQTFLSQEPCGGMYANVWNWLGSNPQALYKADKVIEHPNYTLPRAHCL